MTASAALAWRAFGLSIPDKATRWHTSLAVWDGGLVPWHVRQCCPALFLRCYWMSRAAGSSHTRTCRDRPLGRGRQHSSRRRTLFANQATLHRKQHQKSQRWHAVKKRCWLRRSVWHRRGESLQRKRRCCGGREALHKNGKKLQPMQLHAWMGWQGL